MSERLVGEHLGDIRHQRDTAIARHIWACQQGNPVALGFMAIDKVVPSARGGDLDRIPLQREAFWIYSLKTVSPGGLNEQISFTCLPDPFVLFNTLLGHEPFYAPTYTRLSVVIFFICSTSSKYVFCCITYCPTFSPPNPFLPDRTQAGGVVVYTPLITAFLSFFTPTILTSLLSVPSVAR